MMISSTSTGTQIHSMQIQVQYNIMIIYKIEYIIEKLKNMHSLYLTSLIVSGWLLTFAHSLGVAGRAFYNMAKQSEKPRLIVSSEYSV
jgi:hypothetical protein